MPTGSVAARAGMATANVSLLEAYPGPLPTAQKSASVTRIA